MQDDDDYDYYRENLKENTISNSMVTLYYYNGKEAIEVAKNVLEVETGSYDEPVLVYQALEGEDLPKVKLSKVVEDYNAYELISEALADVTEYFVCNEKTSSKIDLEDVYSVDLSDDGKTAYVSTEIDNEGDDPDYTVTLYKLTLSGSKIKKTEKVDEDVYAYSTYFSNGAYLYFKDVNDEATKGELYMNGKKVDDDVRTSSVSYNEETKKVVYFVDWNSEKGQGTLKTSNGKKATVVKDDVRSYRFTPEGQVLYLYDYSTENYKGELWILNGSKSTKLDDDVVAIIPVYTLD